ncbi:MAG TPA: efflux RND transporter periplasmic adaptor subunit [Spirochaetia bacterium]|nr:efflux RND transporter periplasmic adaptor subunit [Spirochaetia bacterium]
MKKARVLIFPLGAILALVLAGCGATVAAGPPVVQTAQVARGQLTNGASVSGKLAPVQYADLFTLAAGRVATVNVDVGSAVSAGQVLLTLDSASQAAALNVAKAGINTAQAAVNMAQAGENADQITFSTAKANYLRGQALLTQGALSPYAFDNQYKLPYQQSDAKANQVDPASVAQAQAGLQAAQAGVQTAQAAYNNTIMTAPFSGMITARTINPGGMSAGPPALPGETPLLVEVQLDPIYASVNVSGDQVNGLAVGQKAQVAVTGASDQVLTGTISHVAVAADPNTKTYLVEVTLPNPDGALKPGMFTAVTFSENSAGYLLVPNQAVVQQGSDSTVWVFKDGKAEQHTVQLGATDGQKTAVDSGLQAGDQVITSGQQGLTPDEKVTVKGS